MNLAFLLSCLASFQSFAAISSSSLEPFVGEWQLKKGAYGACPAEIAIKSVNKTSIEVTEIRPWMKAAVIFDSTQTKSHSFDAKVDHTKDKQKKLTQSYRLKSEAKTAVIQGSLVSTHLWSSDSFEAGSVGVKTLRLKDGMLHHQKVIAGYVDENTDDGLQDKNAEKKYFTHDNGFSLSAIPYECSFEKQNK